MSSLIQKSHNAILDIKLIIYILIYSDIFTIILYRYSTVKEHFMSHTERDPFKAFIRGLDLSGIGDTESHRLTEAHPCIQVGTAIFEVIPPTGWDSLFSLRFESNVQSKDPDRLQYALGRILEKADPGRKISPVVATYSSEGEKQFDLRDYWQGKMFEKTMHEEDVDRAIFSLNMKRPLPPALNSYQDNSTIFTYGISFTNRIEIAGMPLIKAKCLTPELMQEILPRQKSYTGTELYEDALDLATQVRGIASSHPTEEFGF